MATFKISQDKENIIQFRQKQDTMATHKQRSVLGILDGNKAGDKIEKGAQKPSFGVRNDGILCSSYVPQQQQQSQRNAYPVAQFQAFKVYEDTPEQAEENSDDSENEPMDLAEASGTVEENDAVVENKPKFNFSDLALRPKSPNGSVSFSEYSFNTSGRSRELEVDEYQEDIYKYLRQVELTNRPKPGYMKKQPDITHSMRTILVDWLVEVAEEYKLHTETLYLAVNFIDRFLSYMSVVRAKLQLVGTAAMYIAAKYEEVIPPDVTEFVYITDDTYTRKQVIRMEHLILKVLQFDLSTPSPVAFIKIMSTMTKEVRPRVMELAMYICELGLLEAEPFLEFIPSILAASAIAIAQHTLGEEVWPESFVQILGYKLHQLKRCIIFLDIMFKKAPNMSQKAIHEKYKSQKHQHVAKILPREESLRFPERVPQNGNHQ
ncbi:cyclin-A2-like [Coccinella septempunctata]|uniref:cyclin-A2-like n=1 Tax=Coccinella septempunctata TaxID=41139 RepID=UPI001D07B681|nr:cyclin-A2-like [Coccinella septempunctata]